MIVVDSSAILAILFGEPDWRIYARAMLDDPEALISAAGVVECGVTVLRRDGRAGRDLLERLVNRRLKIAPVTVAQTDLALDAFSRFGKGTGHGAALNFGDCFSYALAKDLNVPLLFKGQDFARTDLESALSIGESRS